MNIQQNFYCLTGPTDDYQKRVSFALEAQESAPNRAHAAHHLGLLYQIGLGGSVDHVKAIEYLGKAILWGSNEALTNAYKIGLQYGADKNEEIALKYLCLAGNNGHGDAATEAARIYEDGPVKIVDHTQARVFFTLGSQESAQNKAYAAHQLALLYDWGAGGSVDHDKAIEYFEKAINWGSKEALHQANIMGFTHLQCQYRDERLIALKYLELTAQHGCLDAATIVGNIYLNGIVTAKDLNKARFFFELAIKEPVAFKDLAAFAAHQLGLIYQKGLGVTVDHATAFKYLEMAANFDYTEVMLDLVVYHRVQGNISEAQKWEGRYKAKQLSIGASRLAHSDGTLLTLASNLSSLEEAYQILDPMASEILAKERANAIALLQADHVLPLSENFPFTLPEGGICQGMTMDFISRFFASPPNDLKSKLLSIAQTFECRSGITALALHSIYIELSDRVKAKTLTMHKITYPIKTSSLSNVDSILEKAIMLSEKEYSATMPIYKIRGQQIIPLPALGTPGELSERECLSLWLKEPDGIYTVGIISPIAGGSHVIVLVKDSKANEVYIWDPSIGLAQCSSIDPIRTITGFLSTFHPGCANHYLDISRVLSV